LPVVPGPIAQDSTRQPIGNPRAGNLFAIISFLQRREGVRFELKASRA
jgi:hypothetical protein